MKYFILVSVLIFVCSYRSFGQNSFYEPAFIVQQTDTVKGYIERSNDLAMSRSISFKTDLNEKEHKVFFPSDIQGFGFFADQVIFSTVQAEIRNSQDVKLVNRFAKILLSGYIELYKLPLSETETNKILIKDNTFIYVVLKNQKYYTLGRYERLFQSQVHLEKRYIGVLTVLFQDCPDALKTIKTMQFTDKAIIEKIKNYNKCIKPNQEVKEFVYKSEPTKKFGPELAFSKIFTPGQPNKHTIGFFDTAYKITSSKGFSGGYFF